MLACDILIVPSREDAMWKSNPEQDTVWTIYGITLSGDLVLSHYFGPNMTCGGRVEKVDTKLMRRIVRYARHPTRDLTANTYFMSPEQAEINALFLSNKAEAKRIEKAAADLFGPLLDAAIEARDKREITTLFRNYPDTVARSFIIMRLRDEFPELNEPGVTLDNWHEDGEGAEA